MFAPLGYTVEATRHDLDRQFPEWGESPYYSATIAGTKTLSELLTHLYVLIPVFDDDKHYFVGEDELEKLLEKGSGWLTSHPEKEQIARRYLKHRSSLYREALARLVDSEEIEPAEDGNPKDQREESLEKPLGLNDQRHGAALAALRSSGARSVLDLGCSEGKFLRQLLDDRQFERIVGHRQRDQHHNADVHVGRGHGHRQRNRRLLVGRRRQHAGDRRRIHGGGRRNIEG
jgi:3' terminal RNA ribose 2'-O-methyltransferase Hen1